MTTGKLWVVLLLIVLTTGCESLEECSLTHGLWTTDELRKRNEPASSCNLELYDRDDHEDILVVYDARSEKHRRIGKQAYLLEENRFAISAGTKPRLMNPSVVDQFKRVRVFGTNEFVPTNLVCAAVYPVIAEGGWGFRLYRNGLERGTYSLPSYTESAGTTARILITPLAVTGDVIMVGSVVGIVGAILWVNGHQDIDQSHYGNRW